MSGCPMLLSCENGVWVADVASCPPPSTCAFFDMSHCTGEQGCRWMSYSQCGDELQNFPQGCYPLDDCATDAECGSGTCQAVEVDPCPAGDCNACTAQANICLP
jgi:hypothetical protein